MNVVAVQGAPAADNDEPPIKTEPEPTPGNQNTGKIVGTSKGTSKPTKHAQKHHRAQAAGGAGDSSMNLEGDQVVLALDYLVSQICDAAHGDCCVLTGVLRVLTVSDGSRNRQARRHRKQHTQAA